MKLPEVSPEVLPEVLVGSQALYSADTLFLYTYMSGGELERWTAEATGEATRETTRRPQSVWLPAENADFLSGVLSILKSCVCIFASELAAYELHKNSQHKADKKAASKHFGHSISKLRTSWLELLKKVLQRLFWFLERDSLKMNFKFIFCSLFVICHLSIEISGILHLARDFLAVF